MSCETMLRFTCDGCGNDELVALKELSIPREGGGTAKSPRGWLCIYGYARDEWVPKQVSLTDDHRDGPVTVCSASCAVRFLNEFSTKCAASFEQ